MSGHSRSGPVSSFHRHRLQLPPRHPERHRRHRRDRPPGDPAFEHGGGKIVIWHGLADQLIFPQGTINYYQRVQGTLGPTNTNTFARLFLAPGAQHCGPAAGPAPTNVLQAVANWVEHGQAPTTLPASGGATNHSPQLCLYPYLSEYVSGNPGSGSSYTCVRLTSGQQQQLTALP